MFWLGLLLCYLKGNSCNSTSTSRHLFLTPPTPPRDRTFRKQKKKRTKKLRAERTKNRRLCHCQVSRTSRDYNPNKERRWGGGEMGKNPAVQNKRKKNVSQSVWPVAGRWSRRVAKKIINDWKKKSNQHGLYKLNHCYLLFLPFNSGVEVPIGGWSEGVGGGLIFCNCLHFVSLIFFLFLLPHIPLNLPHRDRNPLLPHMTTRSWPRPDYNHSWQQIRKWNHVTFESRARGSK